MGRRKTISDDELLAVARAVFIDKGLAASTRAIAREAGVSEAVLYQRFGTKADLFFRAMVPPTLDVEAVLAAPAAGSPLETLERAALGMLRYFRELFPILVPMMSHPGFDFERFVERHPEAPLGRLRAGLIAALEGMRARGEIAEGPVAPAALMLFASLHSVAVFERLGAHDGAFDEATIRAMVGVLWRGLAPPQPDPGAER
ncbi:MAG: TetR/AcrR family transcriptional regulator [Myxococcales bacterium]|nr:TetR/AcrR family transcriptional regulator [Myxococcales bacterium]